MVENIVLLAFIASLCSADTAAFGQFMISRPIFCAPFIGFLMGDIGTSIWIGMIVEMIWINAVPMGVALPIDTSAISILSVVWVCKYFKESHRAAIWGLVLAVLFAYLYRTIDIYGRKLNIKIMHWVEKGIRYGKYGRIDMGVIVSLFFFVARSFLFYVFAMIIGGWIYKAVYFQFPEFILLGFEKAWYILPIAGFGMAIYSYRNIKVKFKRR
ncbi:MAG: PTS sugar transporter subunit IIC [Endomicrobium sp.]|jgi:mannose/fructose/N-acetylgalactosamine-specific phosphotransferase system component IIC|nr:PTS sugar transporter subunit IIC [Endomicrobium sp.]